MKIDTEKRYADFDTAVEKMEKLSEQHFSEYTIEINKYSDGDFIIEVTRAVRSKRLHKFIYISMYSECLPDSEGFFSNKFDYEKGDVLEAIHKPCVGGGLGLSETIEPGWMIAEKIGKLNEI